jgi:hypothetical protein
MAWCTCSSLDTSPAKARPLSLLTALISAGVIAHLRTAGWRVHSCYCSAARGCWQGQTREEFAFSVLPDRLARLVSDGILAKQRNPADRRRELYHLTDAGLALIPVLVELANWGVRHDPEVTENPLWTGKAETDRTGLYKLIRDTVAGCSLLQRNGLATRTPP